jgi:hypothetical protein
MSSDPKQLESAAAVATLPVLLTPAADAPAAPPEHFEQPTAFGRLRWWFEESPIAFAASVAMALVTLGFLFIMFIVTRLSVDSPLASVALQAVQAESLAPDNNPKADQSTEIQPLSAASAEPVNEVEETMELPELPNAENILKPLELVGNEADSNKQFQETEAALREANDALRKVLEKNVQREMDAAGGATGRGVGQIDPNSTAGRLARWVITYPTLPQGEYERMLDFFRIELAYLMSDRKSMQYLSHFSTAGKKRTGDAEREDRMFWYWMGTNRLRELDESIMRKHGMDPTSEVVQLYTKELEKRLADLEKEYLRRQFKTSDVERIAQTNFRIAGGGGTWHVEVTSIHLR